MVQPPASGFPHWFALSLGSNLGDSLATVHSVWGRLQEHPSIQPQDLSSPYRTAPFDMDSKHTFINAALTGWTALNPEELLQALQEIEYASGRTRRPGHGYQDRTLDIDILFYDQSIIKTERLSVPHPEMVKRGFVLVPLAEITPQTVHPQTGVTVKKYLEALAITPGEIERLQWDL